MWKRNTNENTKILSLMLFQKQDYSRYLYEKEISNFRKCSPLAGSFPTSNGFLIYKKCHTRGKYHNTVIDQTVIQWPLYPITTTTVLGSKQVALQENGKHIGCVYGPLTYGVTSVPDPFVAPKGLMNSVAAHTSISSVNRSRSRRS